MVTVREEGRLSIRLSQMYLTTTLQTAHQMFLAENPGVKLSLSKFCDLRPKHFFLEGQAKFGVRQWIKRKKRLVFTEKTVREILCMTEKACSFFINHVQDKRTRTLC